ncbi:MAG: DUF3048 domain-containing protein [Candidatus Nanopelagicaceae bacterium]|nr:DUF3048 domain-containing protein [Candidatus Nanopelagicaceae bacterium]
MISFKTLKISLISLTTSAILAGCSLSSLPFIESAPEPERNVLTGEVGSNGKVIAVKFDDTRAAHPQEGVENADVVIITQVEAGLTRLMGIYSSNYPEQVGPVRSARISDIDILAQYGRVGFMFSGAQSKLRPVVAAANLENLSAERNPPSIYFNDPERIAPYAMMVRIPLLLAKAENVDVVKTVGWSHGELSELALPVSRVKVNWPNASYEAIWSKEEQRFLLNFDREPNFAKSGLRLGSNNLIIQLAEIKPSEYGDKFGGVTPKTNVIGAGTAFLLRDGTITPMNWNRESATSPTSWTLENGEPAYFATGQVWIFLTDQEPEITYPVLDETNGK